MIAVLAQFFGLLMLACVAGLAIVAGIEMHRNGGLMGGRIPPLDEGDQS